MKVNPISQALGSRSQAPYVRLAVLRRTDRGAEVSLGGSSMTEVAIHTEAIRQPKDDDAGTDVHSDNDCDNDDDDNAPKPNHKYKYRPAAFRVANTLLFPAPTWTNFCPCWMSTFAWRFGPRPKGKRRKHSSST